MRKTKLLTSLAAFVLVLGLGACETTSEEEATPDESESTTETTGTSESTPTTETNPDGYVLVGDFTDSNWDAKVDTSSKYYIPLGTTEYKQTVTIAAEPDYGEYDPWDAGLRVVEWGDSWNLVVGSDDLAEGSAEGLYGDDSKNIKVSWGETYDITVTFGETNSILVTVHEDGGNEGGESETIPGTTYTIGETYWFGYEYSNKLYSFTGAIASSYYGGVTTDTNGAVSVTLGEAEGGYTLSFNDSATKSTQYIKFVENSSNRNFSFSSEEFVWEYNATYDTFVALDSTNDYVFIGNYYGSNATYDELRASSIGYLDGTKSSSNTQYPAHLYVQDTPTTLTITGGRQSLTVGGSTIFGVETEDKANHDVTWESSDNTAATVDAYGEVTALAAAESVTITATSVKDATVKATTTISVSEGSSETTYTETADFSSLSTGSYNNGSYDVLTGTTNTTSFVSCDIVWDDGNGGGSSNNTRVNSGGYIQWYAGEVITFAPKDGHTLVEITISCTNNYAKTTTVNDNAASVTISGNDIIIYDIVDGTQDVTVKNADSAQARFTSIAITYA